MNMTIINTALGQIQGEYKDGLYLFKGIKYAQAKRFEAPQPYIWKGVSNATSFSKKAPQRRVTLFYVAISLKVPFRFFLFFFSFL